MAANGYPPYPVVFIEGPWHLRRELLDRVVPIYRVPIITPISHYRQGTNGTPYSHKVAIYSLYDNWPIKYLFERYEYV